MSDYALLGDSITAHLGTLSDWWGADAATWVNAGVSGNFTGQMKDRVATDVPNGTEKCVLLGGINDVAVGYSAEYTQGNITDIVANLVSRGITPIVSTIMPVVASHSAASLWNPQIVTLNTWIRNFAATNGYALAEFYNAMVDDDGAGRFDFFGRADVHPNAKGGAYQAGVISGVLDSPTRWARLNPVSGSYPTGIWRNKPNGYGETLVGFVGFENGLVRLRNWTLRVGSDGYTGVDMTDAEIDACARAQMGIV